MTENQARQPQGIPAGGQFAARTRTESDVTLEPARRPELEGWPESLPEPVVTFSFDEDNDLITHVEIPGHGTVNAWTRGNGSYGYASDVLRCPDLDDDVTEQAQEWAQEKHEEIEGQVCAAMNAAAERVRARVIASVTGVAPAATDGELARILAVNARERSAAERDTELASAALAARKILAEHPEAAFAEIRTGAWENGDFVDGAIIRDGSRTELHDYEENGEGPETDEEIIGLLKNLNPHATESHWASRLSTGSYGDELYTIDLRKAAAWTPGADL